MAEQESDAHPPGTVMQAWTQAWTLNGRLLRPAMVVVAKAPAGRRLSAAHRRRWPRADGRRQCTRNGTIWPKNSAIDPCPGWPAPYIHIHST